MDKQKTQILVTALLVPVLIFFLIKNLAPKKKPEKKLKPAAVEQPALPAVEGSAQGQVPGSSIADASDLGFQQVRAKMEWGRDPFSRVAGKEMFTSATLELNGISFARNKKSYVMINGEILTVGDMIFDYTVAEINKDRVLITRGDESFYLALPQE